MVLRCRRDEAKRTKEQHGCRTANIRRHTCTGWKNEIRLIAEARIFIYS
jgi:hypothetical protein